MITRKEYMNNSSELFNDYYNQFVTEETNRCIKSTFTLKQLLNSKDGHLNDVCKHSQGGRGSWLWDGAPINLKLARELGEVGPNSLPSQSTHTCVGKAAARAWMKESEEQTA